MKKIFIATLAAIMSYTTACAQIETMTKKVIKEDPMLEIKAHTSWESDHVLIWQFTDGKVFIVLKSNGELFDGETQSTKVGLYNPNGEMHSMSVRWKILPLDDQSLAGLSFGLKKEDSDTLYRQRIEEITDNEDILNWEFDCIVMPEHVLKFLQDNPNRYIRFTTELDKGVIFEVKAKIQSK